LRNTGGLFGYESALSVGFVSENGLFASAGISAGDVLVRESQITLFNELQRSRGKSIELEIADGGAGPPFHQRPRRVTRFGVPLRRSG
jgi:hypothetical protein